MNILEAIDECKKGNIVKNPGEDGDNGYMLIATTLPFMEVTLVMIDRDWFSEKEPLNMQSIDYHEVTRMNLDDIISTDLCVVSQEEMLEDLMKQFKEYFKDDN